MKSIRSLMAVLLASAGLVVGIDSVAPPTAAAADVEIHFRFTLPAGFALPSQTNMPEIFVIRLSGEDCAGVGVSNPACFVNGWMFDETFTGVDATVSAGALYVVSAAYDSLPRVVTFFVVGADSISYGADPQALSTSRSLTSASDRLPIALSEPPIYISLADGGGRITGAHPWGQMSVYANRWDTEAGYFMSDLVNGAFAPGADGRFGWKPTPGIWQIQIGAGHSYDYTGTGPHPAFTRHIVKVEDTGDPVQRQITAACAQQQFAEPVCDDAAPFPTGDGAHPFVVDTANVIAQVLNPDGEPAQQASIEVGPASQGWSDYGTGGNDVAAAGFNLPDGQWRIFGSTHSPGSNFSPGSSDITVNGQTSVNPLRVQVTLRTSNVFGTVTKPDGLRSRSTGIQVLKYNLDSPWPDYLRWSSIDFSGAFTMNLDPGSYKLILEPPPSNPELPRTPVFVLVNDNGAACLVSSFTDSACDVQPGSDGFALQMLPPNFTGRMLSSTGTGLSGFVDASVWNGQYYDWVDNTAQVAPEGTFALLLEANTTYRINLAPRATSGHARAVRYVTTGSNGAWCEPQIGDFEIPTTCTPTNTGRLEVTLPGANFFGMITDGTRAMSDGWVEASVESDYGWRYFEHASLRRDGTFSMRLSLDDTWQRIKVTANPPWGSSALVKTARYYWVKGDQVCADQAQAPTTCTPVGATATARETFVLTGGNVSGTVSLPNGDPAPFIDMAFERRTAGGWWEGVDTWARTDASGRYSIGLDDGDYRITARPFGRTDVASTSIDLTVDATCSGCTAADIQFSPPNVTATVSATGQPVARAWAVVERWNADRNYWEWTGKGGETDASGRLAILVPVTSAAEKYRIVVDSPWGRETPLPRLIGEEFILQSTGNTTATFPTLVFPEPNVNLVLQNGSNTVANAWVGLERWNSTDNYWEWIGTGSPSSTTGRVSLYLECLAAATPCSASDYRLVVDSPWGSSTPLPRFTMGLGTALGSPLDDSGYRIVSFPASNVNGRVMLDATTANRGGWVETFQWHGAASATGQWVGGTSVGRTGGFSMALADGDYLLRVNSNGSLATAPIEVIVRVAGGSVTSCTFRSGGSCMTDSHHVDVSFGDLPKNLDLQVTIGGSALTTSAFVVLTHTDTRNEISLVTDGTGRVLANVPAGTYSVSAVVLIDGGTSVATGSVSSASVGDVTSDEGRSVITVPVAVAQP